LEKTNALQIPKETTKNELYKHTHNARSDCSSNHIDYAVLAEGTVLLMIDKDFTQVIEYLDNGKVRVYNIVVEDSHKGDENDPLTTIAVKGYTDVAH
jgi:hypothetical protein